MTTSSVTPEVPPGSPVPASTAATESVVIPVVREQLDVERVRVETGAAVRIRKVVHQDEQDVEVTLAQDDVSVRRVPINRYVTARFAERQEGDTLIVPVFEEVTVVEKRLLLKEEVHLTLGQRHETSRIPVTLTREQAVVERRETAAGEWREDAPVLPDDPLTRPAT